MAKYGLSKVTVISCQKRDILIWSIRGELSDWMTAHVILHRKTMGMLEGLRMEGSLRARQWEEKSGRLSKSFAKARLRVSPEFPPTVASCGRTKVETSFLQFTVTTVGEKKEIMQGPTRLRKSVCWCIMLSTAVKLTFEPGLPEHFPRRTSTFSKSGVITTTL